VSAEDAGGGPGSGAMSDRLRALLSRAAEEQLLEQRQVSAVLGDLRTLLEDVDERLATGEQVERVAAEVRALSARVEARLDAAEARSDELADRMAQATAMVGQAAQDLVGAVVAGVAERLEAQLPEVTADVVSSVGELVEDSERRLGTRVDDAVLALAEVVLRRQRPAVTGVPAPVQVAVDPPPPEAVVEDAQPADPAVEDIPSAKAEVEQAAREPGDAPPTSEKTAPAESPDPPVTVDAAAEEPAPHPHQHDGFVLVPADVEEPGAEPAPPVQQERRTADRRTADRGDGSGRRRRPWWRPV
jgi:ElaB/YqjD/DUF883 family membrane-anchored ribosome-binding protein